MKKKLSLQSLNYKKFKNQNYDSFNGISNLLKKEFNIDFDKSRSDGGLSLLFKHLFSYLFIPVS